MYAIDFDNYYLQRFDRIIAGILKSQWDTVVNINNARFTTWAFPTTTGFILYSVISINTFIRRC